MINLNNLSEIIKSATLRFFKENNITKYTNFDKLHIKYTILIDSIYLPDEFIIEYLNLICKIGNLSKEDFFEEINRCYFVNNTKYKHIKSEFEFIDYVRNEVKLYYLIKIPLYKLIYSRQTERSQDYYDNLILELYKVLPSFNFYHNIIFQKKYVLHSNLF